MHKIKVVNLCESNCLSLSIKKKKKIVYHFQSKRAALWSMVYKLIP